MLKIRLIAVGHIKEGYWREAQAEFVKRLAPFARLESVEVEAEPITKSVDRAVSMKREAERILRVLPDDGLIIAMDRQGKEFDSPGFAEVLYKEGATGAELVFVVGGAAGLDAEVLARAQRKISLSKMTLTHEMARIFLLEQLYRAATIATGKTYHY